MYKCTTKLYFSCYLGVKNNAMDIQFHCILYNNKILFCCWLNMNDFDHNPSIPNNDTDSTTTTTTTTQIQHRFKTCNKKGGQGAHEFGVRCMDIDGTGWRMDLDIKVVGATQINDNNAWWNEGGVALDRDGQG